MMHSCKLYSFLRDQSLEKWAKYIKILIINKRFYLSTEIFRQPTKIEKFNRLPTKIENFNRLPTKLLNFNRQPTSGPPPPHIQTLHLRYYRYTTTYVISNRNRKTYASFTVLLLKPTQAKGGLRGYPKEKFLTFYSPNHTTLNFMRIDT